MSTEEKIKNDEVMSEEELDQVAGGHSRECVGDSNFLKSMGVLKEPPGSDWIANIEEAFDKFGISAFENYECADNLGLTNNHYMIKDGTFSFSGCPNWKYISRREAFEIVAKATGHDLNHMAIPGNWHL